MYRHAVNASVHKRREIMCAVSGVYNIYHSPTQKAQSIAGFFWLWLGVNDLNRKRKCLRLKSYVSFKSSSDFTLDSVCIYSLVICFVAIFVNMKIESIIMTWIFNILNSCWMQRSLEHIFALKTAANCSIYLNCNSQFYYNEANAIS